MFLYLVLNAGHQPPAPHVSPSATSASALIDVLPVPTALLDGAGRIAHCNAAWRALGERTSTFGDLGTLVTPTDHPGTAYVQRLAGLEGPLASASHRLAREIQDILAGRRKQAQIQYHRRRPEGEEAVEALVAALPGPTGPLALVQHIDVSDRERATDAQAAATQQGLAAEIERAKQRSLLQRLGDLGRDLHTPITPVRLELHLLATQAIGPLTEGQDRALAVIARNVQRWADGEQAFLHLPTSAWAPAARFDLAQVAAGATERAAAQALTQGIQLVRPHIAAPLPVQASPDLVGDVVALFIARAIAASPSGSTVAVEVGERGGEAFVEVRDSGAGATPREVRDCFEPWGGRRPGTDTAAPFELPYARWAIQSAGGRVYAESDGPGNGMLLALALPLDAGDPASDPSRAQERASQGARPPVTEQA